MKVHRVKDHIQDDDQQTDNNPSQFANRNTDASVNYLQMLQNAPKMKPREAVLFYNLRTYRDRQCDVITIVFVYEPTHSSFSCELW